VLGLYDSGLGGLTVLRALRAAGIDRDVVYFADQAHLPYGDKTDVQIHGYLGENLAWLGAQGVEAIVAACNSSCAAAAGLGWPASAVPVLDLIETAGAAFAGTSYRRVGVVATVATVRSGAYARAIRVHAPDTDVIEVAAPALVPLVERGEAETPAAGDAVRAAVAALPADLDALVYGCTHYPLLDRWFAEALGPQVARIDPALAQAARTQRLLAQRAPAAGTATTTFYTNGDPVAFERAVRDFTGDSAAQVRALVNR